MVKVEIIPQEEIPQEEVLQEEIPQGEIPREEMAAPIDNALEEKIYKALEVHSEVLKKMGSHLSKLGESKIRKPVHMEINKEEEKEEWDERDKVDYERNKQIYKLTVDIVAIKEKMEKMQLAFHKAQGMDDCLYMGGLNSEALLHSLPKFKISIAEKFDGTGDPKQHVRKYISIAKMKGWMRSKPCLHFSSHLWVEHQGGTITWIQAIPRCGMS